MGFENIEITQDGHTATIWLDRPEKLNAMSADIWADIPEAMESLNVDDSVRVVVLAGRGTAFTVGIDINLLASLQPSGESGAAENTATYEKIKVLQHTANSLADSPKPVIAAVHGYCLGGGLDLITACDIRLAARDAVFSVRETRMGLVADTGVLQRLPGIVGPGHTAELAFTGEDIDAARAKEIGLVNDVYDDYDTMLDAARTLAGEIARMSPLVTRGIKNVLSANKALTTEQALDYVAQWNASRLFSNDLVEAMNAFIEKREPHFKGD
jgi:enoyl-CoA hydratase